MGFFGATPRNEAAQRWTALAIAGCLAGYLVGVSVGAANADSVKALQAVSVTLSSDGTVQGISSKLIAKDAKGGTSTSSAALDPARWGSTLPIRVQTSYNYGSRQGTNLADLAGKSGHFVITVTIENTTAKPTQVQYSGADGNLHTGYALVGTPMTVLATADAGSGNIAHVVTERGTTSGVLSQAPDGHALVQFAAMLAPPQLPATTTFTLVENSSNFAVPVFNIAAEPGLVTDASTESVLQSAFGSSATTVQTDAIDTLLAADTAMQQAFSQMTEISGILSSSTHGLGARTVATLHEQTTALDARLGALGQTISQGSVKIADSLETARSGAVQAISKQIATVQALLVGDPNSPSTQLPPPLTTSSGTCAVPSESPAATDLTVKQQVELLSEWLGALQTANSDCATQISEGIATMVGNPAQATGPAADCESGPNATTLVCILRTSQDQIQKANLKLDAELTAIGATYDPNSLKDLGVQFSGTNGLRQAVQKLQTTAADLGTSGTSTQSAIDQLSIEKAQLDSAWAQVDPSSAPNPYAALDELSQAIDPTTGTSIQTLEGNVDDVCTAVANAAPPLSASVTALCTPDATTGKTPLHAQVDGWGQAIKSAANEWKNGVKPALVTLGKRIDAVDTDITDLVSASASAPGKNGLETTITSLTGAISGLFQAGSSTTDPMSPANAPGGVVPDHCTQVPPPTLTTPALNAVSIDLFNAICNAQTVATSVAGQQGALDDVVHSVAGQQGPPTPNTLDGTISGLLDGSTGWLPTTQRALKQFFATENTNLQNSQSTANTQTLTQVGQLNTSVGNVGTSATNDLNTGIGKASKDITDRLTLATKNVRSANNQLDTAFQQLLNALGGPNSGLLGTMTAQAGQASSQAGKLGNSDAGVQSGNALQQLGLDNSIRAQQELAKSLNDQPTPFGGISVPSGSTLLPVFTYTIGGN